MSADTHCAAGEHEFDTEDRKDVTFSPHDARMGESVVIHWCLSCPALLIETIGGRAQVFTPEDHGANIWSLRDNADPGFSIIAELAVEAGFDEPGRFSTWLSYDPDARRYYGVVGFMPGTISGSVVNGTPVREGDEYNFFEVSHEDLMRHSAGGDAVKLIVQGTARAMGVQP